MYVMRAAGLQDDASAIRGVAIAAITAACLLHATWRKGGILLNNMLAMIKVAILLLIIVLGFIALGGASLGHGQIQTTNFDAHTSFANPRGAPATYANSFIYIIAAYSGFKQPFYVSIPRVASSSFGRQEADGCGVGAQRSATSSKDFRSSDYHSNGYGVGSVRAGQCRICKSLNPSSHHSNLSKYRSVMCGDETPAVPHGS